MTPVSEDLYFFSDYVHLDVLGELELESQGAGGIGGETERALLSFFTP